MLVKLLIGRIKQGRHLFATDSLFRNATYLTGSTLIMSVLGFFFWIFIAHLYSPTEIGVASALIAVTTLISNISLLGLNMSMVRFLPSGKNQSRDINAVTVVVASVTLFAAAVYAFIGTRFSGHIGLLASTDGKLIFTFLMVAVSLNSLTDSVFIANRRGEYHTAGYAMLGLTKLILPLVLVSFGATGIFGAYILAMVASLALSYYLMWRGCGYHFFSRPDWKIISRMRTYAAHNYVGVVLNGLPAQLMPILIIKDIGASSVAFFSMAWTMANLLYVVPAAAMQSLLAEVSNNPDKQTEHVKRMVKMLTILLVPMVVLAIIIAPFMLRIFGPQYQHHATEIFQLFALSTFFVAISSVGNTLLNIAHKTSGVVITQVVNVAVTFGSAFWLVHEGLRGIGISIVLGNLAASVMYIILLRDLLRRKPTEKHGTSPVSLETAD